MISMKIQLPQDIIDRVQQRTSAGEGLSEADVIRQALDLLDKADQERQAILDGIDAWQSGDKKAFERFDREFRAKNNIPADS